MSYMDATDNELLAEAIADLALDLLEHLDDMSRGQFLAELLELFDRNGCTAAAFNMELQL